MLCQGLGRGSASVSDQSFRETFRNDVLDLLSQEFIAAVSELFLRLKIEKNDFPTLVHHHHRIRSRLQQPAVPAFHLRQMLFHSLALSDVAHDGYDGGDVVNLRVADRDLCPKQDFILGLALPFKGLRST